MRIYLEEDSRKPKSLIEVSKVDILAYEHLVERIEKIIQNNSALRILDCFSGSGYGSYFVSQFFNCNILAIDGSLENLIHANKYFSSPKIISAAKKFPFYLPLDCFDFVLCIESLEHLPEDMHEDFLDQLVHCLKPGGRLFLSTPSSKYSDYESDLFPSHYLHLDLTSLPPRSKDFELINITGLDLYRLEKQELTRLDTEFITLNSNKITTAPGIHGWSTLYEFIKK